MPVFKRFVDTARKHFEGFITAAFTASNHVKGIVYELPYGKMSQDALSWMQSHPNQSAFIVVGGTVFFVPSLATAPTLAALGFSSTGPVAGKLFANYLPFLPSTPRQMQLRRKVGLISSDEC